MVIIYAMTARGGMATSAGSLPARATRNRIALLALLDDCTEFVSAQQLQDLSAATAHPISLTTVYRTLRLLEQGGLVDVIRDERGERLYRRRRDGEHRHYLVCRGCGRSVVIDSDPVERWAAAVGPDLGFAEVEHVVELTGVCGDCRA